MNRSLAMAVGIVVMLAAGMPLAQDAKAPASPGATAPPSGSSMNMASQMGQMDEHMSRMQALHQKMANSTTPEERQKLMDEQRQEMQQGMAMMHDMHQGGPMMGGAGKGMMSRKAKPADQATRMQMMEKRMDMMQMMMQTMMDQQGAPGTGMMAPPTK